EILARYGGQLWELRARIPINQTNSIQDLEKTVKAWEQRYYDEYGLQAMAPRGGLQIITIAVEPVASTPKPQFIAEAKTDENPDKAFKGERKVYFDGSFKNFRVYSMGNLLPGNLVLGPSIIEGSDTTLLIPDDRKIVMDKYRNMLMRYR
ncbi:MAG: hypothetical protein V3W19_01520, partial [Desulfatiglandales bacterium]